MTWEKVVNIADGIKFASSLTLKQDYPGVFGELTGPQEGKQ
jgi:hypothetical protein